MCTPWALHLPPGGPKVRPCRFSTLPSTLNWKMLGVVSDENVIDLDVISSGFSLPMNCCTTVVFAVPGPPTSSVALPTLLTRLSSRSYRTLSSVGMTRLAYLGVSLSAGYVHVGTRWCQCSHSWFVSLTRYSNTVSTPLGSASGTLLVSERRRLSNLARSSNGTRPPMAQTAQ